MRAIPASKPVHEVHPWLHKVSVCFIPGPTTLLLDQAASALQETFRAMGHAVLESPNEGTNLLLTTAPFAQPVNWRESLLFTGRKRFMLRHAPMVITMLHARPGEFRSLLDHFETALAKESLDPADFSFPGLAPSAHRTLIEQGRRGGAILPLLRLLQAQSKSIRILLFVGEEHPQVAYHIDLAGSYPCTRADAGSDFYEDIVLRIVTALSTDEVTMHLPVGEKLPYADWKELPTPSAMRTAARELGRRDFFTDMVRIDDLVHVPSVHGAVARQYSEGCFATWEPHLEALVATITGSARPVDKDNITDDELVVIVGVRPDGKGALVRPVEGKHNDPPSSEAVEMMAMDQPLPRIEVGLENRGDGGTFRVPVARSKLHGHRGVAAYHPGFVEFVRLDPSYYSYPVSCATEAQARGIRRAFSRSEALRNPSDPRQLVFTLLPGHGVVMVEKWQAGKAPFQLIWEFIDAGHLEIDSHVPQGEFSFTPGADGRLHVNLPELEKEGGKAIAHHLHG